MDSEKQKIIAVSVLLVASLLFAGFVFWNKNSNVPSQEDASLGEGALIYPKIIVEEPIDPKKFNPKGVMEKSFEGGSQTQENAFIYKGVPVPPRPKSPLEKPSSAPPVKITPKQ